MNISPWQVLHIDPTDDLNIIKKAYAKLIKTYRPDEHPEKFQEIRQAYENIKANLEQEDSLPFPQIPSNKKLELTDKERLFKALDKLMDVYDNLATRNNLKSWLKNLRNPDLILYSEDIMETGHSFIREILKYEYLYITEKKLKPEVYLTLLDFFQLNENKYLLNNYNAIIAKPLMQEIRKCRLKVMQQAIPPTKFNQYEPLLQAKAEIFLKEEIMPYSSEELLEKQLHLINLISTYFGDEKIVLQRVVFKYVLDNYLRADLEPEKITSGLLHELFSFKEKKRTFIKIFNQLNYHQKDILNCLNFCQQSCKELTTNNKKLFSSIIFIVSMLAVRLILFFIKK